MLFQSFPKRWLMVGLIAMLSLWGWSWAEDSYRMDDNAIYHLHQGQKWMEIGQYEAAVFEFQIGIRLKPKTAMTAALYNNLGQAYLKIQDYPKAIISFQEALNLNPNFSLYYENLIEAYQKHGALEAAQARFLEATQQNHENAQAWYLLGLIYKKTGENCLSKAAFETYLRLSPYSELADAAKLYVQTTNSSQTPLK